MRKAAARHIHETGDITVGRTLSGACWLLGLMLGLASPVAVSGVTVQMLPGSLLDGNDPPGSICWVLAADGKEGLPEDFDASEPTAPLFCPDCLHDKRYAVDEPLRRIDQRLIPPPDETGNYSCAGFCQQWLLRPDSKSDAALLFVRVGVPTICGATGWCPGRIYERADR